MSAERPWGNYETLSGGDHLGHKVKKIQVFTGKRLSLQSHKHRNEHWIIVKGNARVQIDSDVLELRPNDRAYIPAGSKHRIENTGDGVMEFIEVQVGSYLGEDDIERYEDDYGRV